MSTNSSDLQAQLKEIMNEENQLFTAKYAVSMHKYANRRAGIFGQLILVIVIACVFYFHSFWPLAVGAVVYIAIHLYLIFSCVNFVTQKTGMSRDEQAHYSRLYKTNSDPAFTTLVDDHYKGLLRAIKNVEA